MGVIGLIHVGARYTSITLLHKGISIFTRRFGPIAGEEFTDNLKKENLNLGEKDRAIQAYGCSGWAQKVGFGNIAAADG